MGYLKRKWKRINVIYARETERTLMSQFSILILDKSLIYVKIDILNGLKAKNIDF